jgi:hypothetical protein
VKYIAGSLANGDLRNVGVEVEDSITRGYPWKGLQVTIFEQLNGVPRSLGGRRKKASRRKYWNGV